MSEGASVCHVWRGYRVSCLGFQQGWFHLHCVPLWLGQALCGESALPRRAMDMDVDVDGEWTERNTTNEQTNRSR